MSTKGKEYQLAIRIAGIVDKSFSASLASTKGGLAQIQTTINAIDSDFVKLDKGFDGIVRTGEKCFSAIASAAGVASMAVAAATAASVYEGSQFESAFAGVKKTVDATAEEYAALRQNILDMTREIPSSASDIAGVMEIAGQLGIATESLTEFTETMINLGVSTNLSAEEAATNLAKFANIVNMADYGTDGISNWERLGSVVVDLGNNFATTEADIVEMATRLASTGSLVGLTESQIMALATAMSSVGIQAESGGSTMAKLLKKMQLAVELNSDSLADYAAVAGMTGEQFRDTFESDAVVALSAFIDGLNDTERNGKSAIAILDDMKLSEIRLSNTVLALAGADGVMTDAIETANSAWDDHNALAIEAGKRYETVESQAIILKNALSEIGITAYDDLRDPLVGTISQITEAAWELNDYIGGADGISKWIDNINKTLPTLQRNAKNAWKTAEPFFDGVLEVGKWCTKNPEAITGVLSGIASAMLAYKAASTTVHSLNSLTNFIGILAKGGAAADIMLVVGAIGTLVAICETGQAALNELADDNLADHFGDIALSLEDVQKVAAYIVGSKDLDRLNEALGAFDDMEGFASAMDNAVSEINKMNWKVSIGMELTADEQEDYKTAIDEYVQAAEDYALQNQYAVSLNLSLALDGADADKLAIGDKVNAFYQSNYQDMVNLGDELSKAVNDAFADGVLDPNEIENLADIQRKMAELQEGIAQGEFTAKLSAIQLKYDGSNLTADSFKNIQSEIATQLDTLNDTYLQSYIKNMSANEDALSHGSITQSEYDALKQQLEYDYIQKMANSTAQASQFQFGTISDQYMPELSSYMTDALSGDLSWLQDQLQYTEEQLAMMDYDPLQDYFMETFKNLSSNQDLEVVRKAVEDLLKEAQPTVEQMQKVEEQCQGAGVAIPKAITDGLKQYTLLQGVVDGNMDAFYELLGQSISGTEYEQVIDQLEQQGRDIPDSLLKGLQESNVIDGMYAWTDEKINEVLSKGFTASADVDVTLNPTYSWANNIVPSLQMDRLSRFRIEQNADGGIWDHPILTTFAERSMEAAIPIDGSQNAINLWEKTGRLLGMDSVLDKVSLEGGSSPVIEYNPVLKFYGDAPSKDDIADALSISQDQFESLMERYLKDNGRVSFG